MRKRHWAGLIASVALAMSASGCIISGSGGAYATTRPTYVSSGSPLIIGSSSPNYGIISLASGFVPDPISVHVVSGGELDARSMGLGPGCVGWVTRQPDYVVRLTTGANHLRFFVQGAGDTTLIINDANGGWRCNDDSYGGLNPTVDFYGAPPGQYDVWVGSYRYGERATAVLNVTELDYHP
jgi:hypothetical protein